MSISIMTRAAALVLVAGAFAGCARAEALDPAAKERLDEANATAAEAVAAVDDLEARIEDLEDDLAAAERIGDRVDSVSERLGGTRSKNRTALDEDRSGGSDPAATADAAAGQASQAARDLDVLGNRYDYHLRRFHGGG